MEILQIRGTVLNNYNRRSTIEDRTEMSNYQENFGLIDQFYWENFISIGKKLPKHGYY